MTPGASRRSLTDSNSPVSLSFLGNGLVMELGGVRDAVTAD